MSVLPLFSFPPLFLYTYTNIPTGGEYYLPPNIPSEKSQLLRGMLTTDPVKRFTVPQVMESDFFQRDLPRYLAPLPPPKTRTKNTGPHRPRSSRSQRHFTLPSQSHTESQSKTSQLHSNSHSHSHSHSNSGSGSKRSPLSPTDSSRSHSQSLQTRPISGSGPSSYPNPDTASPPGALTSPILDSDPLALSRLVKVSQSPTLNFELISGLGRMEPSVVDQLTNLLEGVDREEIWDALRRNDERYFESDSRGRWAGGMNCVKVAYLLLRDKNRLGQSCETSFLHP